MSSSPAVAAGRLARQLGPLLAAALATGCHSDRSTASAAIRAYDEELVRAFRTSDHGGLAAVAAPKEAERIRVLVDMKRAARVVLESELQGLEVTAATQAGPDAMTAEARERWRYHDRPLDPGRPPGTVYVSDMTLRYHLRLDGGAWKVAEVDTLANHYLEPAGFSPEARARQQPHSAQMGHGQ